MERTEVSGFPEDGELVLGTVDSIFKQGAFISLDEYSDRRGLLHLSEISLKWVRNIRDYLREGQKVVLFVLKVDPSRGHIDLSLRRVNDAKRKEKLQEVKQRQRSQKLFELLAQEGVFQHRLRLAASEFQGCVEHQSEGNRDCQLAEAWKTEVIPWEQVVCIIQNEWTAPIGIDDRHSQDHVV